MATSTPVKKPTSSLNTTTNQKKILRIGIVQNGRIVEEKLLRQRGDVSIGRGADNTFLIPSKDLPRSFKIFEETRSGYLLNFVKGMDARLAMDGKILTLSQILERGEHVRKGTDYYKLDLAHSSRGKLVIGEITVLFHFVVPPPEMPKPQLPHVMWGMYAIRSWLGNTFLASTFLSVFVATPLLIWIILEMYDPNWKPDEKDAKAIVAKAMERNESKVEAQKKPEETKGGKDGEEAGKDGMEPEAAMVEAMAPDDGGKPDTGPVTEENVGMKADAIASKLAGLKDVDLSGVPKDLNLGPALPGGIPNLGQITAIPAGLGGNQVGPITAGEGVKTLQVEGECSGPTCVASTGPALDPNKIGDENRGGPGGPGGSGGPGGPGGPGRIGTPGVPSVDVGMISVTVPMIDLPTNVPMIDLGGPMDMITDVMVGPVTDPMTPSMDPPRPTASASGLVPGDAPLDVKKVLQNFPYTIGSCFQNASAKGLVGNSGDISVTVSVSGGKLSVSGLGGSLAGNGTMAECVKSRLNGKSMGTSDEAKNYSKSWTFSVQLVGATSN